MKKLTRLLSILLALVLCLSVCCAGIADETAAVDDETLEAYFTLLFSQIADADPIDWKGFEEEFNAKVASGAEITMEDCLPAEAWKLFNILMRMKENTEVKAEEDLPYTIDITVTGNRIATVLQLKEQSDEETTKKVADIIKADFESKLSLGYLKDYIDQFVEAGVKAENITMTLQYLNADGTVLYEGAYTYTDLAAAVNPAA